MRTNECKRRNDMLLRGASNVLTGPGLIERKIIPASLGCFDNQYFLICERIYLATVSAENNGRENPVSSWSCHDETSRMEAKQV